MKKSQGFTLIELIIVIIILGILAVTAAPKFIGMQDDARKAQLKGVKGAIAGAMTITYGKSALQGDEKKVKGGTPAAAVDGVLTSYGYPVATSDALTESAGFDNTDFTVSATTGTIPTVVVYAAGSTLTASAAITAKCYVQYTEATSSDKATVIADVTSC